MSEVTFQRIGKDIDELTFEAAGEPTQPVDEPLSFQRIVLAVDGSPGTGDAIAWTRDLAACFDASVWITHVVPSLDMMGPFEARGWVRAGEIVREREGQAAQILEDASAAVQADRTETVLAHGRPSTEICSLADEVSADLVVLASHEHRTSERVLLGSTADTVKDHTAASVLIARNQPPVDRLLAATDGSLASKRATGFGLRIARAWKARLDLLHVFPLPVYSLDGGTEPIEEAYLEQPLAWDYPRIHKEIRFGDPAERILETARDTHAGLICVGTRGLGGLRSTVLGSVSRRLAHEARASVLAVREPQEV